MCILGVAESALDLARTSVREVRSPGVQRFRRPSLARWRRAPALVAST